MRYSRKNQTITRLAYNECIKALNDGLCQTPTERKWYRDIGGMYEGTLRDIRLSTKNTYLQSFHYRVVSRIISTNTFLYRIGKSESAICTFCNLHDETLCHFLWECAVVKEYIKEITFLKDKCDIATTFTSQSWFFPRISEESKLNILIITIAKAVIFRAKYKETSPSIQHFLSALKLEAQKENESTKGEKNSEEFCKKWKNVLKAL